MPVKPKRATVRRQKVIRGYQRIPMVGFMDTAIEHHITVTQSRFHVSRSFVIAVACAHFFGVKSEKL